VDPDKRTQRFLQQLSFQYISYLKLIIISRQNQTNLGKVSDMIGNQPKHDRLTNEKENEWETAVFLETEIKIKSLYFSSEEPYDFIYGSQQK